MTPSASENSLVTKKALVSVACGRVEQGDALRRRAAPCRRSASSWPSPAVSGLAFGAVLGGVEEVDDAADVLGDDVDALRGTSPCRRRGRRPASRRCCSPRCVSSWSYIAATSAASGKFWPGDRDRALVAPSRRWAVGLPGSSERSSPAHAVARRREPTASTAARERRTCMVCLPSVSRGAVAARVRMRAGGSLLSRRRLGVSPHPSGSGRHSALTVP